MSELPNGWELARIGDICKVVRGGSPRPAGDPRFYGGDIPFIKVADLTKDKNIHLRTFEYTINEAGLSKTRQITPNTLLLTNSGATLGVPKISLIDGAINDGIAAFLDLDEQLNVYLYYFWLSKTVELRQINQGAAQPNLNTEIIRNIEIPLPPLNEQKRIAAKLDALLERVDACRARLERVPLLLKRFRQAVLAAATSGQLTEDWREQNSMSPEVVQEEIRLKIEQWRRETPPNKTFKEPAASDLSYWRIETPESWETVSISSFAKCLDYLRIPVKREERASLKGLYPYYGANGLVDMVDEFIFDDELVLVTEDETFYGREKPIAYRVSGRCWVNNHAHVLQAGDKASSDYLCYSLMYYNVLPWLTGTTGRAKLTQAVLNSLPIAVPPKKEMEEIVRRVETLFAYADRLEARYQLARAEVERLTPALLAKAFRGELVPQDPNDEPAAALLARIQAERATTTAPPRSRSRSATPATPAQPVAASANGSTAQAVRLPFDAEREPAAPTLQTTEDEAGDADDSDGATADTATTNTATTATNGHRSAPPDIEEFDRETLLATLREVFTPGTRYDSDTAIRTVAHTLGYARTGARIHERLKNTLRVAVQRGILVNESGEYRLDSRSIADYTHDECVATLLSALPRAWTDREEAIKAATRYLGFRRTGPALHAAFKSAITGAIRRGFLEYDRAMIRKHS